MGTINRSRSHLLSELGISKYSGTSGSHAILSSEAEVIAGLAITLAGGVAYDVLLLWDVTRVARNFLRTVHM